MYRRQLGVSMVAMLAIAALLVIGAIAGLKIAPAYMEFFKVKSTIQAVAAAPESRGSVAEVRRAFDKRALIDDISVIGSTDLEITKEGGEVVISFSYPKKIGLFGNVSLLIEFAASSNR